MRVLSLLMLTLTAISPAAAESRLQPVAFLAGHCWKGTFPDGKQQDEHCFEWFYEGKFLRDRHVVTGGEADYRGESVYYWDSASSQLHFIYFNVLGGVSQGTVQPQAGTLQFPEERYTGPDGKEQVLSCAVPGARTGRTPTRSSRNRCATDAGSRPGA